MKPSEYFYILEDDFFYTGKQSDLFTENAKKYFSIIEFIEFLEKVADHCLADPAGNTLLFLGRKKTGSKNKLL